MLCRIVMGREVVDSNNREECCGWLSRGGILWIVLTERDVELGSNGEKKCCGWFSREGILTWFVIGRDVVVGGH